MTGSTWQISAVNRYPRCPRRRSRAPERLRRGPPILARLQADLHRPEPIEAWRWRGAMSLRWFTATIGEHQLLLVDARPANATTQ